MKQGRICFEYDEFEIGDNVTLITNEYADELGRKGDEFAVSGFCPPGIGSKALIFLEGYEYGYQPSAFRCF